MSVSLSWDVNTDQNFAGYKVYYQANSSTAPFSGTGAVQGASPVDVHATPSATITGLDPANSYYFAVTAYDTAGNESVYSNIVSIAEALPPTVAITSPAANANVTGTASITASASDNVGVTKVEFYVNGVLQATDTGTPYLFSWNTLAVTPGAYTLSAKAYDAAGNVGQSTSVAVNVVNDTTAPTVALTAPANGATVSGVVALSASASDNIGVSKVEFYENGLLLYASNVAPYTYSWNSAAMANGSYTLTAKAYDAAGNVGQSSSVAVTVANDFTAPTVGITSPAAGSTLSGTVAVAASATDNVGVTKVEFYLNGALVATDTAAPYGFSLNTLNYAAGSYTLSAKAYDAAGNVGLSSGVSFTIANDAVAPTVAITSPAAASTLSGTVAVAASATDNVGVTKVEFYLNGVLVASDTAAPHGFSLNTLNYANGSYTLSARAYDAAGNVGQSSSVTVNLFNDTTAPVVAIASPSAGATIRGTVAVSASASDNVGVSRVEFFVNGSLVATSSAAPFSFSLNTLNYASGSCTLSAKAYDAAGNVGQSSSVAVTIVNDTQAPVVAIVSPSDSSAVKGTVAVSVSASDNVGVTRVELYVNGSLVATDSVGPYSFSWNSGAFPVGYNTLVARAYDAAGNATTSIPVTVKVADSAAPVITIASPTSGAIIGTDVVIAASATDNVSVKKIQVLVDGYAKYTVYAPSLNWAWNTVGYAAGSHTISIRAYDTSNNVSVRSVTVVK